MVLVQAVVLMDGQGMNASNNVHLAALCATSIIPAHVTNAPLAYTETSVNRHAVRIVKQLSECKFVTKATAIVNMVVKLDFGVMRVRTTVGLGATGLFAIELLLRV